MNVDPRLLPFEPDLPRELPPQLAQLKASIISDVAADPVLVRAIYDGARRLAAIDHPRHAGQTELATLAPHVDGVVSAALSPDVVLPLLNEHLSRRLQAQEQEAAAATQPEKPVAKKTGGRRRWAKTQTRAWSAVKKKSMENKAKTARTPPVTRPPPSHVRTFSEPAAMNGDWAKVAGPAKQPEKRRHSRRSSASSVETDDDKARRQACKAADEAWREEAAAGNMSRPSEVRSVEAMEQFAKEFGTLRTNHRRRGRRTPDTSPHESISDGSSRVILFPREELEKAAEEERVEAAARAAAEAAAKDGKSKAGATLPAEKAAPAAPVSVSAAPAPAPAEIVQVHAKRGSVIRHDEAQLETVQTPLKRGSVIRHDEAAMPIMAITEAQAAVPEMEAVSWDDSPIPVSAVQVTESTVTPIRAEAALPPVTAPRLTSVAVSAAEPVAAYVDDFDDDDDSVDLYDSIRDTFSERFPEVDFSEEIVFSQNFRRSHPELQEEIAELAQRHMDEFATTVAWLQRLQPRIAGGERLALPQRAVNRIACMLKPRRARFAVDPVDSVHEIPKPSEDEISTLFYTEAEISGFQDEAAMEGWF